MKKLNKYNLLHLSNVKFVKSNLALLSHNAKLKDEIKELKKQTIQKKYYVYSWWSGIQIEQQESLISKIKDNTIYFYNDYCKENQKAAISDCRVEDNYYICNTVQ